MIAAVILAALTLHVTGPATRSASPACGFVIVAKVVEGGSQRTCLTSVRGYPGANAVIRSSGTMTFTLKRGTIRAHVSVTQRFGADGKTAKQTLKGTIVGGTRRYKGARGSVTGGGTLVDTANGLRSLKLAYRLTFA